MKKPVVEISTTLYTRNRGEQLYALVQMHARAYRQLMREKSKHIGAEGEFVVAKAGDKERLLGMFRMVRK